ncbi:C39 family peptidase [Nocardioides sp. URHA0020]|uniref:C39 family peptidase n=1 Tax=Nocardioides sp. URHA0020 TaxID=1380392 RepID=UPI00048E299E|nr:C39 family peptidase [Nocardioides sp. URHA0020]
MSRPRAIALSVGALALLLALTPFVPRGHHGGDGGLRPSGDQAASALLPANAVGPSRVTPAMQSEIDRVVAAGRSAGRLVGRATPTALARSTAQLVRCADLDGQRYCLGVGWTDDTQADVQDRVASAARMTGRVAAVDRTGDLDAAASLARTARMSPAARARSERSELELAARSVAKVWLLRHEMQGVALPAGFLARHPEARATVAVPTAARTATASPKPSASAKPSSAAASTKASAKPKPKPSAASTKPKTARSYPERSTVMTVKRVTEQKRTYWCGPTSMQMIAWGAGKAHSQQYWADKLGTTTGGTAITDMVRVINRTTTWDSPKRAGTYVTLDIGDWSFNQWMLLMMRHIHDYRAPVVLHPALLKRYYPYLDDDASGHYQVGRGYDKNGAKPTLLGYFEPWNQQRFDPSEPYIARVQWRRAYKSYRANQAHFLHNVGV